MEIDWHQLVTAELEGFALSSLPPTLKLPALPHAVTLFVQKSNDPSVSSADLSKIVETDTGLTVELLRYVNSSFIGLRNKAKSVIQAITQLGMKQCKLFLVTTGMQAALKSRQSKLINQACFWNASLQKALFAREIALILKADTDLAFAGGLMQDFLLPVLTNELLDPYIQFTEQRENQPAELCDYETQKFGWNHAVAAASLAMRWKLPEDIVACLLFHHAGLRILTHPQIGRTAVAAVALSALLPDQLRQSYDGLEHLMLLEAKWPSFNIRKMAENVDEKHDALGLGIVNDFPLSRRLKPILDDNGLREKLHAVVHG